MSKRIHCVMWVDFVGLERCQHTSWFDTALEAKEFADELRKNFKVVIKQGSVALEATGDE